MCIYIYIAMYTDVYIYIAMYTDVYIYILLLCIQMCIYIYYIAMYTDVYIYICKLSPLQLGGPCWAPRFCRGPQGQVPNGPITKSNSALPAKILLSTKSRTFHKHKVWQGRFLHATESRSELWKTSKFITF